MPLRKCVENHSISQNFLICILGYNGDKCLNLNSSENLDKFGKASANWANESGTQMELIVAKKVHKKISWDCSFNVVLKKLSPG